MASAQLMDGTDLARSVVARTATRAGEFFTRTGRRPCLAIVLVGGDPASVTHAQMKRNRSSTAGIESRPRFLAAETSTETLVAVLTDLSRDPDVDGILLQHPVPPHVDERTAFEAIAPEKDVDGVTMRSFAAMALGQPGFQSCTPAGIMRLLDAHAVDPAGQQAVVIGCSPVLGKPVGLLLLARHATVTYCHSRTRRLPDIARGADILVAAVGKPNFVRGDWIKPGAVVLDAGYNEGNIGDVAFDEAVQTAALLTPVPGGLGPMTIAVLLEQTVDAACSRAGPPVSGAGPM